LPMGRSGRRTIGEDPGPAEAHVVGIAGRGMTGLAQILVQHGFGVTCSGQGAAAARDRLRRLGIRVHSGHEPCRVPRSARLLVYAPEIGRDHSERLSAARRGVPQASHAELLNLLIQRVRGIAFVGGQGAASAAAMVGWTLVQAGLDPTVVLGRAVPQLGGWGRLGSGPHCVVEAVGVRGELAPQTPHVAVLLNLEPVLAAGRDAQVAALRRFVASVPRHGYVVGSGRSARVVRALQGIEAPVELISLARGCAWWGADLREERGRYRFRAFHRGRFVVEARLQVPGRRNVLNALAAIAVCDSMAVPAAAIKEGLEEFAGLSRGFQSRGSYRGVTLVDDEAHDPRAVAEVLSVCRQVFGRRRLWVVLRMEAADSYEALATADCVLVADRDRTDCVSGAYRLVQALAVSGVTARCVASPDAAVAHLERHLEPGDVLLTLGTGDVGTIADALTTRRAPRDHHG
jgi:UDP-N-acetylmuramate--alanine ligase